MWSGPAMLSVIDCLLIASLTGILSLAGGAVGTFFWLRRQAQQDLNSASARARDLVSQAEKNAENIVKEAELKAKDEVFSKREEFNREVEKFKNDQRDHERKLEKKADLLEQKDQMLLKKERQIQHNEKKHHERREHLEKKIAEAEASAALQTQKLHEITGLSREEAERRLLERVDKELADEVARRISKHEEEL